MWAGHIFSQEAAYVYEKSSLSDDEDEDLARTLQISSNYNYGSSSGKDVSWIDVEYTHIDDDEEDQLAHAFEESTQLSKNSRGNKSQLNFVICDVCEEQVLRSKCSRFIWFWRQTYCEKHHCDGSPICFSCFRFKIGNVEYPNLNDGRKICLDCYSTSILDSEGCKSLASQVYTFYRGLNMDIRNDNVQIFLVDQIEMNDISGNTFTKGLTTYKAETIISVKTIIHNDNDIKVVEQVQHLNRNSRVTSMLLVYGYPKLATGATLAHEMMHAWMMLEGCRSKDKKINEGLCELMGYKWIEWYGFMVEDRDDGDDEQAQFLRNYRELLKNQIEERYDEDYGYGFRQAKWAVERYGLQYTLKTIAKTGKFPD